MSDGATPRVVTIEAGHSDRNYWRDLWAYRELMFFLAWRDVLVRYKQTLMGAAWAIVRPFATMIVFTVVFGGLAKLPSNGAPYPIMVFAALLPWQFFASALADSGNSLAANSNLISKVYFPRLLVPISATAVCLVDFAAAALIMAGLMAWYGYVPSANIIFLPLFLLIAIILATGMGMFLSAASVRYRDFRQLIPFAVQFGIYVSPVGFTSSIVPEKWQLLYSLNPMVGVIEGFRWSLLGGHALDLRACILAAAIAAVVLWCGVRYFRATEKTFVDVI